MTQLWQHMFQYIFDGRTLYLIPLVWNSTNHGCSELTVRRWRSVQEQSQLSVPTGPNMLKNNNKHTNNDLWLVISVWTIDFAQLLMYFKNRASINWNPSAIFSDHPSLARWASGPSWRTHAFNVYSWKVNSAKPAAVQAWWFKTEAAW